MRYFIITLLFLAALPAKAETAESVTFDDVFAYAEDNRAVINESLPGYAQTLLGSRVIEVVITDNGGTNYAWIETNDGAVVAIHRGEHTNPDIRITTDLATINRLNATVETDADAATQIRQAITRGDITVEILAWYAVAEKIDQAQPTIETSLVAAVPVIAVANPSILAYLPHLRVLIAHFFNWLLGIFGIRKKRRPWGTIYDATTKQPLDLAVVRLYKLDGGQAKLADTQVTDKTGRFGFLPQTGQHRLEIVKPLFTYPSTLVAAAPDNTFETIYRGETLTEKTNNKIIGAGVPLDPINPADPKAAGHPAWRVIKKIFKLVSSILLVAGFLVSVSLTAFDVTPINVGVTILYIILISVHFRLKPKKSRYWGMVYQSDTHAPVPLASVSIIDTKYNKRLQTRLSDYQGRFAFFPPAGDYTILVQKKGFTFPSKPAAGRKKSRAYFGETFTIKKDNQAAPIDIPVDLC